MNDLFDKINNLFAGDIYPDSPTWAKEILLELRRIRVVLEEGNVQRQGMNDDFREFVANFRAKMKANVNTNYYPEVTIEGRRIGVDHKGLLYDKQTLRLLNKADAFRIYSKLYKEHCKAR